MYIPDHFQMKNQDDIARFIAAYPFATLISVTTGDVTHVPLMCRDDGVIEGHMARNNPHCKAVEREEKALAVFHGPHGYVSPTWYEAGRAAVPTWNYAAIHVHGTLRRLASAGLRDCLHRLVEPFEAGRVPRWRMEDAPETFLTTLAAQIVGFSLEIDRIEAKFKLGQNRSLADRQGTIAGLKNSAYATDHELAAFMERYLADRAATS